MATQEIELRGTYPLAKGKIMNFNTLVCHYRGSMKTLPQMYKNYEEIDVVVAKHYGPFESGLIYIYKYKGRNRYRMEMYKTGMVHPYSCIVTFKMK